MKTVNHFQEKTRLMNIIKIFLVIGLLSSFSKCNSDSSTKGQSVSQDTVTIEKTATVADISSFMDSVETLDHKAFYLQLLSNRHLKKKSKYKDEYGKKDIIYLGAIVDSKKDTLFHVISEHKLLKLAITTRSSAYIYYFSYNMRFFKQFEPDVIPFKLQDNIFFFKRLDSLNKVYVDTLYVGTKLPEYI